MKVLLINPGRYNGLQVIREERCEIIEGSSVLTPYSLLQAGALIDGFDRTLKIIDANALDLSLNELEKRMKKFSYDVMLFKFTPTSFREDIKVAEISKKINPKAKTIGICYSLWPIAKKVMSDAKDLDIFIGREFEVVVPDVFDNLKNLEKVKGIAFRKKGKTIVNKNAAPIEDYDSLPIPAFHLLPSLDPYYISVKHGKPFTILYSSKGCPYNCMYCNVPGQKLKMKSVDRIMKEIDHLKKNYGIRTLSFFDETFTMNHKRVYELCKRMEGYNIKWYCNTRTNLVDLPLLKAMRKGGCRAISFGIESGSQKILDNVNKGLTVKDHENAIKWADEAGIKTHCSFIFGLPGETFKTVNDTLEFIKRTLPRSIEFNIATPYPGTKLYDYMNKKGMIKKNIEWEKLYQDLAQFENRELPNVYLEAIRKKAHYTLFLNPRWFFKNFVYVIKNPDDFTLAFNYMIKLFKDIFIHNFTIVKKK